MDQHRRNPRKNLDTTYSFLASIKGPNKIQEKQKCFFGDCGWKRVNFWQEPSNSLYLKANDDRLNFDNKADLGNANDNYSGGLFVLGLCLEKGSHFYWLP